MGNNLKKTNYVVVSHYEENQTLDDCLLLGWNNKYDWFDNETCGYEILTPTERIKKNHWGLIKVNSQVSVYVGETIDECRGHCEEGNREGYNCTVCKLNQNEDEWQLIPV
jgi:hypothetical protein